MNNVGTIMNQTEGPFNTGFKLIGWTVGTYPACPTANYSTTCSAVCPSAQTTAIGSNCITDISGAGVLSVIGLVGLASIVLEFVEYRM